ncbi:MAG TPA: hypothetical protein VFO31_17705 [Vicinamibacterales bacterium]|nr:hypothetical protein [Vicinamibacterales bacterium]
MKCKPYTDAQYDRMPRRLTAALALAVAVAANGLLSAVLSATTLLGGPTALSPLTAGLNRLANGDFEAGATAPWSVGAGWSIDRRTAHTGSRSLRREAGASTAKVTLALPAGTYRFSAWVKTQNLGGGARLRFDARLAADRWFATEIAPGTANWREYAVSDVVMPEPATVSLSLEADDGTAGTAWFDDVTLEALLPPALETFLLYPNFRGTLFDDGPPTLTFDVRVTLPPTQLARHTVRGVLREEVSGRVVVTASYPARGAFVAELDGRRMHTGTTYLATFALTDAAGAETSASPAYRVARAAADARASMWLAVDRRNRIEREGVPRFLLGGDDRRMLGGAANHADAFEVIDASMTTAADAFTRYAATRSRAPELITLAITSPLSDLRRWRDVADMVSMDAHAMFGPEPPAGYDHGAVARATALSRAAVRDARPVVGVLPFTPHSALGRWPTLAEMRAHAYMAIVEGARGLWWSTAAGELCGAACGDAAPHVRHLESVVDELARLEPVLLAEDAEALAGNSNPNIKTKVKLVNGKGFVLAYNASGSRQSTTFTWMTTPETVSVHAENRALVTSGPSFSDTFAPFGAHVYVVDAGVGRAS